MCPIFFCHGCDICFFKCKDTFVVGDEDRIAAGQDLRDRTALDFEMHGGSPVGQEARMRQADPPLPPPPSAVSVLPPQSPAPPLADLSDSDYQADYEAMAQSMYEAIKAVDIAKIKSLHDSLHGKKYKGMDAKTVLHRNPFDSETGWHFLHFVAGGAGNDVDESNYKPYVEIIELLVANGATIDQEMVDGTTPLMTAAKYLKPQLYEALQRLGANTTATCNNGKSVAEIGNAAAQKATGDKTTTWLTLDGKIEYECEFDCGFISTDKDEIDNQHEPTCPRNPKNATAADVELPPLPTDFAAATLPPLPLPAPPPPASPATTKDAPLPAPPPVHAAIKAETLPLPASPPAALPATSTKDAPLPAPPQAPVTINAETLPLPPAPLVASPTTSTTKPPPPQPSSVVVGDADSDEEHNPFAEDAISTYEALYLKVAASKDVELGAAKAATLLKKSGLNQKSLKQVWNTAKRMNGIKHSSKGTMNFDEFSAACDLAVASGGKFE